MAEVLVNSAVTPSGTGDTTLNNGGTLTSGATSLTVATLPTYVSSAQFRIRIDDEIMIVTAIGGTGNKTWTVTRGAEGTAAASHADGSNVYLVPTAGGLGQWLNDFGLAATKLTGNADKVLYVSHSGVVTELALAGAGKVLTSQGATSAPSFAYPGLVLLEQHTASGSASLDFTSWYTSDFNDYLIELLNVIPATNGTDMLVRLSTDGGTTWDSGSNYYYAWQYVDNVGDTGVIRGSPSTAITLFTVIANTLEGLSGTIHLFGPGSGVRKSLTIDMSASQVAAVYRGTGIGLWSNTAAYNGVRFLFSSGNIASGTARVYGVAK